MATQVLAHITGTVWKVEKNVGDRVDAGEAILIIESMKMEMPVESPCSGKITEIRVAEKQPVEEGAVVALVE
jgi:acetyl-CoA carboxylase biotin carboxyl carrier protein